jgi:micrococcal nuclease
MYTYRCVVRRIVDGDTVDVDIDLGFDIWIKNQRIRLYDVDAPETYTSDKVEEHFGEITHSFVSSLLRVGESYKLYSREYHPEKYGRILGDFEVYVNDSWTTLTKFLLDEHLAVKYDDANGGKERMDRNHLENRRILIEEGVSNMSFEQAGVK